MSVRPSAYMRDECMCFHLAAFRVSRGLSRRGASLRSVCSIESRVIILIGDPRQTGFHSRVVGWDLLQVKCQ